MSQKLLGEIISWQLPNREWPFSEVQAALVASGHEKTPDYGRSTSGLWSAALFLLAASVIGYWVIR